jgi:hypothetical protein
MGDHLSWFSEPPSDKRQQLGVAFRDYVFRGNRHRGGFATNDDE